jgi:D-glycero-D-manno-heptose 1,7-bisphosphate phosphatase
MTRQAKSTELFCSRGCEALMRPFARPAKVTDSQRVPVEGSTSQLPIDWRMVHVCNRAAGRRRAKSKTDGNRSIMSDSALFLDRDGVINVDRGYIHRPEQFEFVPGIFELDRFWTNELRRPIVVVTNQSGIGRGYFDQNTYAELTRWMCDRFAAEGTAITRVYHCPYHPLDGIGAYRCDHSWRKPNPGMLLQAASDLELDPARCAIIGDKMSDMEAGAAAGIGLRILLGPCEEKWAELAHDVVADLGEALALVRARFRPEVP